MSESASDYHHGDQDIAEQVSTYRTFGTLTKWGSLGLGAWLLALVLWFCVGVGLLGGLVPALVLVALGIVFLRSSPDKAL